MAAAAPVILLTGGTGFVGRQVLDELIRRGHRVRLIVRDGKQDRVARAGNIENVVVTADAWRESVDWWAEACRGVDIAIHAAWYVEPGRYLQSPANRDCFSGTLRLAEGAIRSKIRRFAGIGTCFEYDLALGDLSVRTALRPATPYAQAKADAFQAISPLLPAQGIEFVWCRLFYLYGAGEDRRRLVPYLRAKLAAGEPAELSSGTQVRDYLDVRDAGRMIVEVALGGAQGPVNVCSGRAITVRQLAERIADEYGRRDLLRFGARTENLTDPPYVVGVPAAR